MNRLQSTLATLALAAVVPLFAFASGDHKDAHAIEAKVAESTPMTDGEIKKIDKDNGKITIKHGEIKNLDMPGMTMVFRVKDSAMLDQVKVGDKINFAADNIKGSLTVTKMEVSTAK